MISKKKHLPLKNTSKNDNRWTILSSLLVTILHRGSFSSENAREPLLDIRLKTNATALSNIFRGIPAISYTWKLKIIRLRRVYGSAL